MITEGTLSPVLVGRDDEITLLEDALLSACRGEGQVVALAGDAGLGKTRLATETADAARKIGAAVIWGGCSEAEYALPYLPFVEGIGNWLAGADLAAVRAALGPAAGELGQLFPQFGDAIPAVTMDPSQSKLRLYEAVLALLRVAAGGKGALVVIEDLHWADPSSRELVDYMTRRVRGTRIMVLATYRRDEMHRKHPLLPVVQGWRRSRLARIIELEPLPATDVASMIAAIFDYREVSPEFRDFLYERTEGNPFVLEEMLKEAIDRGDIYRTETRWERKEIAELGIPRSVADSILLRVERLDPDHAEVLRRASVIGPSFDYRTLVAITGMPEPVVQSALQACVLQQLLSEEPGGRYRFRHSLTREAVYEDIIEPRRRELHSMTADVLTADPATQAVDLAGHLLAAGRWSEAVPVCLRASHDAFRRSAFVEAADLAERVLAYITDDTERAGTLALIGESALAYSDGRRAVAVLERAVDAYRRLDAGGELAHAMLLLGRAHWTESQPGRALETYEAARVLLTELRPSRDLAVAYIRLAGMAVFDYRGEDAANLARHAIEIADGLNDDFSRVWAALFLGAGLAQTGAVKEGIVWMNRTVDESIALGFQDVAINAIYNTSIFLFDVAGDLDGAESLLNRFDELAPHPWTAFARAFLRGCIYTHRGKPEAAAALFETALRDTQEGSRGVWRRWIEQWLMIALALGDRLTDARAHLRVPGETDERQDVIQMLSSALFFALIAGDVSLGESSGRRVVEEADYLGGGGHIVFLAAECLRRAGRTSEAQGLGDIARTPADIPWYGGVLATRGSIALGAGRTGEAVALLRDALDTLETHGLVTAGWIAALPFAEACAAEGLEDESRRALQNAIDSASERGAAAVVRLASETAARIGVDVSTPTAAAASAPRGAETAERIATVMFADVRGYTSMTLREAPADMYERMTSFYRWARNEIEKRDGLVDRYVGDAVMASWNTAVSSLDHTALAVETAVAIQDKAALMDLPVGVGIAVGAALVGQMTGSENIDVIGETPNLAARLQAQAAPGEIALSEEAYRRARTALEQRGWKAEERLVALKGYDEPVRAYVVARG